MTETKDNVHWFSSNTAPTLVFNINAPNTGEPTFDPRKSREKGRYYVDPTAKRGTDGLIAAREIEHDEAIERFAKRRLTDFPLET